MNLDDKAYLFYLLVLLIFMVSSFSFYKWRKLSTIFQQITIWGLLFFWLIIGYGFKDNLIGQLFPHSGVEAGEKIIFSKANDGHFYVQLKLNGKPIKFLIDTGASNLTLNKKAAEKIGINIDDLAFTIKSYTANGVTHGAKVRLNSVQMGQFLAHNIPAMVNQGNLHISLLGMDFLKQFGEIHIKGNHLTLTR